MAFRLYQDIASINFNVLSIVPFSWEQTSVTFESIPNDFH